MHLPSENLSAIWMQKSSLKIWTNQAVNSISLRRIEAAIHARNKQLKEPLLDEFLIHQFIKLPTTVQPSVAEGFCEDDPAVAQILNPILGLAEQEKRALVLWLEHVEKLVN